MPKLIIALDRSSVRQFDADGRLHVLRSHISKATVNPYYGREIPDYQTLGLDPDKIYKLFRDPVELERAAPTFARLPILKKHVPVTVEAPQPDLVIGAIGSNVIFEFPYLDADKVFWDATAIAGIDTGTITELSCAYRYVAVMEPGEFEGQAYDGKMTEIRGNHLALVEIGRAGPDVVVADQNPFIHVKESAMKMTRLGKALFAALSVASPVLAADSALPALVGQTSRKTFNAADVKAKLMALDASLDSNKLDAVLDAILDVEQEPEARQMPQAAADESPADKIRAMLAGKVEDSVIEEICGLIAAPAADAELPEPGMKKEEVTAAMDSLRADLRAAAEACRDVRPVVGDVIGMDSAADVYGFALDHLKVDRKDVQGVAALRALFKIASGISLAAPKQIAQDSAGAAIMFPNASRFKQG